MIKLITGWFTPTKAYVLLAVVLAFGLLIAHDRYVSAKLDSVTTQFDKFKADTKAIADAQELKYKQDLNDAQAKSKVDSKTASNQLKLVIAQNNSLKSIANKLRSQYETKSAKLILDANASGVLSRYSSGVTDPQTPSSGQEPTSVGSITDPTCAGLRDEKEQLEEATAVETILYNRCREALDADAMVCERLEQ